MNNIPRISQGLLSEATVMLSPHHNERPVNTVIDLLVIHGISLPPNEFGGSFIHDFFCGRLDHDRHPYFESLREMRVSAHLLIDRQGHVTQFVPFHLRAWHAGESSFAGRTVCNDFSIGIELEGADHLPYTSLQYETLARVTAALMQAYPAITLERIVGHSDIAPGRKTDPGDAFLWHPFKEMIQSLQTVK